MDLIITTEQLTDLGLDPTLAHTLCARINMALHQASTPAEAWQALSKSVLAPYYPFILHQFLFTSLFPLWHDYPELAPAWLPTSKDIETANVTQFMSALNMTSIRALHSWTIEHYQVFWQRMIAQLDIIFSKKSAQICDLTKGVEAPEWFPGAKLNIVDSCFRAAPKATAIIYEDKHQNLHRVSYAELLQLVNRIAASLVNKGFKPGDAIAIAMPMNLYAVAIYLGIIKMGGVVVSIADSFSGQEIETRLRIAQAKAIFTQDFSLWGGKKIPLYEKIKHCSVKAIVIAAEPTSAALITSEQDREDMRWEDFLGSETLFTSSPCDPMSPCNILFSSGTTAEPKAIIWNHTTPIKAASDAFFHQNIQSGDVLTWPTNLGWMMGPWLIFAAFINQATIALYTDAPKDKAFGEFVERAEVTMLGVVPTLVATWRQSHCMEEVNWSAIKVFSSTGECSNPEDMLYLMSLAGYKPVIEYCGGTEIGGAYISSTVVENNYPSLFSTVTMGLNITILDEDGKPATQGEVAIIPPSIGLSTTLLNADHYRVYFTDMPKTNDGKILRRHGDQIKQFPNGYYAILGRVDDTMNLGGIKTSAAEIERTLVGIPSIIEVAAIAVPPPDNGPSQLVIYAATEATLDKLMTMKEMQKRINAHLNPLFKIHDVVFTKELPKTASNKIMRRVLRKQYIKQPG